MIGLLLRSCVLTFLLFVTVLARAEDCGAQSVVEPVGDASISVKVAGDGPDVVLLHGLFAQKEQWDAVLCALANAGFRVSAPDLPGYAQSRGFGINVYALEKQADLLDELMRRRGIERVHLAGNSMGGAIAAIYAQRHARRVATLAFIGGPQGIVDWGEPVKAALRAGVNPFIPTDVSEFEHELELLLMHPPALPDDVKQAVVDAYAADRHRLRQIWDIFNLYGNALQRLPRTRLPTLIVWGRHDGVFPVDGARALAARYPNSRRVILDDAGHLPMLDTPQRTAAVYADFLHQTAPDGKSRPR